MVFVFVQGIPWYFM